MGRCKLGFAVALFASVQAARATGLLLPADRSLPALAIKNQRVSVTIANQVAQTHVKQVFQNSIDRDLEAVYIFPLPKAAAISEFAMLVNGKRVKGELLEKARAAQIYRSIVARMRDPGLLEYMGNNLLRVRVYPVPRRGEQVIEVRYSQVIKLDSGIGQYVYPLKTGKSASRTLEDFSLAVSLQSRVPIKTVYSPSHKVSISRKSDREAVVGFEEDKSLLDRDFLLYYTLSEKDFGLNLLTHREKGKDGFFMLMVAPKVEVSAHEVIDKDMCFVIDTSGSMAGEKIRRAQEALKYCVRSLGPNDRFNIVRFSTDVEPMARELVAAKASVKQALAFIDGMEARGGTNIDAALAQALQVKVDPKRPYSIVFLTDGKPTVGETGLERIVKNVASRNAANSRIFVFGVGDAVNTHLLDRVSGSTKGCSEYVKPDEEIETKVSLFYNKASKPVLANLSLDFGPLKIADLYPQDLPDLFQGSQLTLFGRYTTHGDCAMRLKGDVRGKTVEFVYESTFKEEEKQHGFIPALWARRKIGYLLDEIRLRGENQELKDEVIRLSKEYGIATPYTSYLVVEEGERGRIARPAPAAGPGPQAGAAPRRDGRATSGLGGKGTGAASRAAGRRVPTEAALKVKSGKQAVAVSKQIAELKRAVADSKHEAQVAVRTVGGREFRFVAGVWTQTGIKPEMKVVEIEYGSDAYFALFAAKTEWQAILKLGPKVAFVANGRVIKIGDTGSKKLTEAELKTLTK